MNLLSKAGFSTLVFLPLLSSCCRVPDPSAQQIQNVIQDRSGYSIHWDRKESFSKEEWLDGLLMEPLHLDEAVQVALFNSPRIQALFEEIGIAQGDFINACILSNPLFGIAVRIPNRKHLSWNTEMDLLQPIIRLLTHSRRKRMAISELNEVQSRMADALFSFIEEVSLSYFYLKEKELQLEAYQTWTLLAGLAYQIAEKQFEAGNINPLERDQRLTIWKEAEVRLRSMEIDRTARREALARLLGLTASSFQISLDDLCPENELCSKEEYIEWALAHRLDVRALQFRMQKMAEEAGLLEWWTYTDAALGISLEKDTDGINTVGPALAMEVPIFNFGQGDRARLCAEWQQTFEMYLDCRLQIIQEVSTFYDSILLVDQKIRSIESALLPNRKVILDQTIRQYNFMNAGVYDVISAKMQEIETEMLLVANYREYYSLHAQLTRALGGGKPV